MQGYEFVIETLYRLELRYGCNDQLWLMHHTRDYE